MKHLTKIVLVIVSINILFVIWWFLTLYIGIQIEKNDVDEKYYPYLQEEFNFVYEKGDLEILEIYTSSDQYLLSIKVNGDDYVQNILKAIPIQIEKAELEKRINKSDSYYSIVRNSDDIKIPAMPLMYYGNEQYFLCRENGYYMMILVKDSLTNSKTFYEILHS